MLRILALAALVAAGAAMAIAQEANPLTVTDAWTRATPGAAPNANAAVYFTIRNPGPDGDSLIGADTDAAQVAIFHTSETKNGVMHMERAKTIDVPARATVSFAPGGMHLMLMELKAPLKEGDKFSVTLHFRKQGEISVPVQVMGAAALGPAQ